MKIDISIIIVSYNTSDLLLQCLKSIYKQTLNVCFEVIVVDNASIDGSQQMVKNQFNDVILLESKENMGFGRANNLGVKNASGEFLFLLNSDTVLIENSLKSLMNYVQNSNDPNIAAVGCKMLGKNKNPNYSYGNFPSIYQEIFEYGISKLFRRYYKEKLCTSVIDTASRIKKVDYIIGADMFLRKTIFDKINGFDEDFFLYYEETELCYRLNQLGYKIIYFPNTSIIHYSGASSKKNEGINYWILEQFYKSKYIYYKKCHGVIMAKIVKYLAIPRTLIFYRKYSINQVLKLLLKS